MGSEFGGGNSAGQQIQNKMPWWTQPSHRATNMEQNAMEEKAIPQ